jgi:hypothetical protein
MSKFIKSKMKNTQSGDLIWESKVRQGNGEILVKARVNRKDEQSVRETFRMLNNFGFNIKDTPLSIKDDRELREEIARQEELRMKDLIKKRLADDEEKVRNFMKNF